MERSIFTALSSRNGCGGIQNSVVTPSACVAQFSGSFARDFAGKSGTRKSTESPPKNHTPARDGRQQPKIRFQMPQRVFGVHFHDVVEAILANVGGRSV